MQQSPRFVCGVAGADCPGLHYQYTAVAWFHPTNWHFCVWRCVREPSCLLHPASRYGVVDFVVWYPPSFPHSPPLPSRLCYPPRRTTCSSSSSWAMRATFATDFWNASRGRRVPTFQTRSGPGSSLLSWLAEAPPPSSMLPSCTTF